MKCLDEAGINVLNCLTVVITVQMDITIVGGIVI